MCTYGDTIACPWQLIDHMKAITLFFAVLMHLIACLTCNLTCTTLLKLFKYKKYICLVLADTVAFFIKWFYCKIEIGIRLPLFIFKLRTWHF